MPPPRDPYRYFRLEARELLDAMGKDIAALEQGGSDEAVARMLRHAHTLKGAARVVRQRAMADEAHAMEDVLDLIRDKVGQERQPSLRTLSAHLAVMDQLLRGLDPPPVEASPGVPEQQPRPVPLESAASRTVRAEVVEFDKLLDGLAEVHSRIGGMRSGMTALEEAQRMADLLEANLAPRALASAPGAPSGQALHAHGLAAELTSAFGGIGLGLAAAIDQADRELGLVRENIEQMRLLPARLLFATTELAAREAAHMVDKQVRFEGQGGDIRLDAPVIEAMQRVLIQLVRNALAHGIGTAAQRATVNKPAAGLIRLTVARKGDRATFEFSDDGNGVDIEALRRIARERGMQDVGDGKDDADSVLPLLMASGISTARRITETSGRGVGLDIVREAVEQLHGTISIDSEAGRGTRFLIEIPLSLSSIEALHFESGGLGIALPIEAIAGAARLSPEQISITADGSTIDHDGTAIPFLPLDHLLQGAATGMARIWSAIILKDQEGQAAIGVDRLLGASRLVVRPLPPFTPCEPIVAGTWLDGQGNPQLLLDGAALLAAVRSGRAPPMRHLASPPHILVIDDSMTTRMLEESILLAAGYAVDTATCAEEALVAAHKRRYDLFLVDVEMPGMDGFTFVETIRADPTLGDIPAILVTSRNAPDDLRRGTDAGAQGYIVKGEFDQRSLLTLIRDLTG